MLYKFFLVSMFLYVQMKLTFAEIKHCNEIKEVKDICSLVEKYESNEAPVRPLVVRLYIDIVDVIDFNQERNTMTLFIKLWTKWNDTRITLSNHS